MKKMRVLKNFQKNGTRLSEQFSHIIYIVDHAIKIVDQKMYDSLNGKEGIVFIGKTDDFVAYIKEWKKLDELQLAKYKNVKAERIG